MLFLVIGLFELLVMKSTGYGIEKQQRERYNRDPLKDLVSIYLVFSYYNSRDPLKQQISVTGSETLSETKFITDNTSKPKIPLSFSHNLSKEF